MTWLIIGYYLYLNRNKCADSISSSQLSCAKHTVQRTTEILNIDENLFILFCGMCANPSKLNSIQKKKQQQQQHFYCTDERHTHNSMIILLNVSFLHFYYDNIDRTQSRQNRQRRRLSCSHSIWFYWIFIVNVNSHY